MSLAVVAYQLIIAIIIIMTASMGGRKGCAVATGLAAIWTLTHIFMPWLMILQFGTIFISFLIGMSIAESSDSPSNNEPTLKNYEVSQPAKIQKPKQHSRGGYGSLFGIAILIAIGYAYFNTVQNETETHAVHNPSNTVVSRPKTDQTLIVDSPRLKPRNRSATSTPKSQSAHSTIRKTSDNPSSTTSNGKNTRQSPYLASTLKTQQLLTKRGYRVGHLDGVYGEKTREAIIAFQKNQGLRVDGEISTTLLAALDQKPANKAPKDLVVSDLKMLDVAKSPNDYSFAGISRKDKSAIERLCKRHIDPVLHTSCIKRLLSDLRNNPADYSFSGISRADRKAVEKKCKPVSEPGSYNKCIKYGLTKLEQD